MMINRRIYSVVNHNRKQLPLVPVKISFYALGEERDLIGVQRVSYDRGERVLTLTSSLVITPHQHHPFFISYMRSNKSYDGVTGTVQNLHQGMCVVLDALLNNSELHFIEIDKFSRISSMFKETMECFREYRLKCNPKLIVRLIDEKVDFRYFELAEVIGTVCRIEISPSDLRRTHDRIGPLPSVILDISKENKKVEIVVRYEQMRHTDLISTIKSWTRADIDIPGLSIHWEKSTMYRNYDLPPFGETSCFGKTKWIDLCDHFHAAPFLILEKTEEEEFFSITREADEKQLQVSFNCIGDFVIALKEL